MGKAAKISLTAAGAVFLGFALVIVQAQRELRRW
jgi:hypothetical protein